MRWTASGGVKYLCQRAYWLRSGWQRWRERRQLRRHDLSDLGLSRADIEREARKPWWQE